MVYIESKAKNKDFFSSHTPSLRYGGVAQVWSVSPRSWLRFWYLDFKKWYLEFEKGTPTLKNGAVKN
jgi:hypothetical protein